MKINILPKFILKNLYYFIIKPHLFKSSVLYKFSDEKLKYTHLLEAINYIRIAELNQVYFEFGCHSARTFSAVINHANFLKMYNMEFYAFDSFQGLPDTEKSEDGIFKTGEFKTTINEFKSKVYNKTGYKIANKYLVEGFYSNSLTKERQNKMPKVGVVHIDVDLYSSTVEVLNFLLPLLTIGTVILFDDWYCFAPGQNKGESKAFKEFLDLNKNITVENWKNYSTFGKSFIISSI
jgi:hypothetical protein